MTFNEHDFDVAVRTVLGQARVEGSLGMFAMGHLILNRCYDERNRWPNTVRGVCLEDRQFSCWNPDSWNADNLRFMAETGWHDPLFREAALQFLKALTGAAPDPTGQANHYHHVNVPKRPAWAEGHQACASIGNHVFYSLP